MRRARRRNKKIRWSIKMVVGREERMKINSNRINRKKAATSQMEAARQSPKTVIVWANKKKNMKMRIKKIQIE